MKRRGYGVVAEINHMKEEVADLSFRANYYQALGQHESAKKDFRKLAEIFRKADSPKYAAEDARDTLQREAAKQRKLAQVRARRKKSQARRSKVEHKRMMLKALPNSQS